MKELNDRLLLQHNAVDADELWLEFCRCCVPEDVQARIRYAFRKEFRRAEREPGDISSEDEEHVSPEQLHLESCVDTNGNPIEFDGEHVLAGKRAGLKKTKHMNPMAKDLLVDTFVLFQPDPGCADKIWLVQVKSVNQAPKDPVTWIDNDNQKWDYMGGWWELSDKQVLGKIAKCMSPEGVVRVHKNGTNTKIDWSDQTLVAELSKGKKKLWLQQYFNRDTWGGKEIAVNIVMNGKKDSDRAFSKHMIRRLHIDWPRNNYDSDIPRPVDGTKAPAEAPPPPSTSTGTANTSAGAAPSRRRARPQEPQQTTGVAAGAPDVDHEPVIPVDSVAGRKRARKQAAAVGPLPVRQLPPVKLFEGMDVDDIFGPPDGADWMQDSAGGGVGGDMGDSSNFALGKSELVSARVQPLSRVVSRRTIHTKNSMTQIALRRAMKKTTGQGQDDSMSEGEVADNRQRHEHVSRIRVVQHQVDLAHAAQALFRSQDQDHDMTSPGVGVLPPDFLSLKDRKQRQGRNRREGAAAAGGGGDVDMEDSEDVIPDPENHTHTQVAAVALMPYRHLLVAEK
jgi:hypothetical protein